MNDCSFQVVNADDSVERTQEAILFRTASDTPPVVALTVNGKDLSSRVP